MDLLTSEYLAFERHRIARRQYVKAFGGMAMLVGLGAVFGSVPVHEAAIVCGLLLVLPLYLVIVEIIRWYRLARKLRKARAEAQAGKNRKKSISTAGWLASSRGFADNQRRQVPVRQTRQ